MGLNITQAMNSSHFENRESLRNTAKDILNRQNASQEATQKIMDKILKESIDTLSGQITTILKDFVPNIKKNDLYIFYLHPFETSSANLPKIKQLTIIKGI